MFAMATSPLLVPKLYDDTVIRLHAHLEPADVDAMA